MIELLAGRAAAGGFDHNTGFASSGSYPLTHGLALVVEPYGYTELNRGNPAFASMMAGFTYQVRPRLYLDTGLDVGVTHGAPNKRLYFGVTYALANLYAQMKSN